MAHWLEEAEKKQQEQNLHNQNQETPGETIERNKRAMDAFLNETASLTERVSKINPDDRKPCTEIGCDFFEYENRYEFYGTAQFYENGNNKVIPKKFDTIIWRKAFIYITNQPGKIKLSIHEKKVQVRQNDKTENNKSKYLLRPEFFNSDRALWLIDWLAFKKDTSSFLKYLPKANNNHKSDKRCFIATAVYGTSDNEALDILRKYRDEKLSGSTGKALVNTYYLISPPVARIISKSRLLRRIFHVLVVSPAVKMAKRKS